jgi:hypothetical protein
MKQARWNARAGSFLPWVDAGEAEPLVSQGCRARSKEGDTCALASDHRREHVRSGLVAWLEGDVGRSIIRVYPAWDAARLESIENALFHRFGFALVASHDLTLQEQGGISFGWALAIGALLAALFAPTETIEIPIRIVCYARTQTDRDDARAEPPVPLRQLRRLPASRRLPSAHVVPGEEP